MKPILLLVNSGARRATEDRDKIAPALEKHGVTVIPASEKNPGHFAELIARFREQIGAVVVAGGDGTSLCAAKELANTPLPLGILPMGTANNLARSLGIPFELEAAAKVIADGHTKAIDLAYVNDLPFLNVSGMGLSTQVNREVPGELKKRWGTLAYAIYLAKVARRMRPFRAEIVCDGRTTLAKTLQISVCNGRHYGSGLTIKDDAAIDDERLDLLAAKPRHWWEALSILRSMRTGKYTANQEVKVLSGKTFEIHTHPRMTLDTDGEITTRTPARYRVDSGALTVFAPAGSRPGVLK